MTYKWIGENWGRSMIRDAIKAGYTIEVHYERGYTDPDYKGTSFKAAWDAVVAVDECHVFLKKEGERTQWAFIVLEYDQNGDDVINDIGGGNGWLSRWWDAKFKASYEKDARS
jgi:hypothetical protein